MGKPCRASLLIYYDATDGQDNGIRYANMLVNLSAHFDPDIATENVADYLPGELDQVDRVIYMGTALDDLPKEFLSDAAVGRTPILWLYANFDQFQKVAEKQRPLGFRVTKWTAGEQGLHLVYKGRKIVRASDYSYYEVQVTGTPQVFSTLENLDESENWHPHFLRDGNVWFLVENPLPFQTHDDRYLVFADLLHEFFQADLPERKLAMIRFEDLAPGVSDCAVLRDLATTLYDRGAPFSFGVIPIYMDPKGRYGPPDRVISLKDDPELIATLRYMEKRGGTLLMHGVTHQHGSGISREDWEFVQGPDNVPLEYDSKRWMQRRVLKGLDAFWSLGWAPRVWETPHYSASHGDYAVLAHHFEAFFERPMVFPLRPDASPRFGTALKPNNQLIPYFISTSTLGAGILPETLGCLSSTDPTTNPDAMLQKADRLAVIRDGVPSFFFHPGAVDKKDVLAMVDGLMERGYRFVGPETFLGQRRGWRAWIRNAAKKAIGKARYIWLDLMGDESKP